MKKCNACKVPLEGIMYKISSKLFGIKPSESKEGACNKCENKKRISTDNPVDKSY